MRDPVGRDRLKTLIGIETDWQFTRTIDAGQVAIGLKPL